MVDITAALGEHREDIPSGSRPITDRVAPWLLKSLPCTSQSPVDR
ncbi:hypothetical protein C3B79_1896 [Aeromonas hydrophila]|nr:hypothetical protein C3B79_1896 [Aeromonas hydrophila]